MFALIIPFLVIPFVLSIDNSLKSSLNSFCRNKLEGRNRQKIEMKFESLMDYMEDSQNDCSHSRGVHLTRDLCPYPSDSLRDASVFFSDDKQFIYIYFLLGKVNGMKNNDNKIEKFRIYSYDNSLFVLWIKKLIKREDYIQSSVRFDVSFDSTNILSDFRKDGKLEDQLLLKGFKSGDIDIEIKGQTFAEHPISISNSYFIRCGKKVKPFTYHYVSNCKPEEENERIRCKCEQKSSESPVLYYILCFIALTTIISTKPFMETLLEVEKSEKTVFVVPVSCNERNYKYRNCIILRLAKESPYTDLKDVTIDFELFSGGPNYESIAPEHRIRAIPLESRPVVDIKYIMLRLTKLPELKLISVKHSGQPDLKITLLGVIAQNSVSNDTDSKLLVYKVNKHIVRSKRRFNLKLEEDPKAKAEIHFKSPTISQISLKILEVIFILFVVISFIEVIAAAIKNQITMNVFARNVVMIVICTLIGIAFNFVFVWLYKWLLLMEVKQQTRMSASDERLFYIIIRVFYVISIVMAIVANVFVYIFMKDDNAIEVLNWFAIVFCSSALTGLFWNLITHLSNWSSKHEIPTDSEMTVNSQSMSESFA